MAYKKKYKKNDESIIVLIITLTVCLFMIFIYGLYYLCKGIIWFCKKTYFFIKSITDKKQTKSTNNESDNKINITSTTEKEIIKEPDVLVNVKKSKKKNIIFNTKYDQLFETAIKTRGKKYFSDNKIINYKLEDNLCSSIVKGNENYNVSILFDENNEIKEAKCSCPYYMDNNIYCKHIYALLLEYCNKIENETFSDEIIEEKEEIQNENVEETITEEVSVDETDTLQEKLLSICDSMDEILGESSDFYYNADNQDSIELTYSDIEDYESISDYYKKLNSSDITDYIVNEAEDELEKLRSLYEEMTDEYINEKEYEEEQYDNTITYEEYYNNNEEKDDEEERQRIKDKYGLSDSEVDEVMEGHYDPWNFEEEDLEEEDYYYEDDD